MSQTQPRESHDGYIPLVMARYSYNMLSLSSYCDYMYINYLIRCATVLQTYFYFHATVQLSAMPAGYHWVILVRGLAERTNLTSMSRAAHLLMLSAPGNKNGDARHVGDGAEEVTLHQLKQMAEAFAVVAEVHGQSELGVPDHKVLQDAKELSRAGTVIQEVAANDEVVVWLEAAGDRLGPVESAAVNDATFLHLELGIEVQQRVQGL